MARIGLLFDEYGNRLHCAHVDQRTRAMLDEMLASSAASHDDHIHAAYEHYGRPHYCASIGDSMGNQIRIATLRKQEEVNLLRSRAFHEYIGIGLHNQHVIDYQMTGAGRGQLLDLTYYNQIYSVPLLPRR